jgi:predicted amidohydrolase
VSDGTIGAALRIAAAQPATVACDVRANALAHAEAVDRGGVRVVVFPELSLTGYEFDAPAVEPGDLRLAPLVDACRAAGAIALVGAPVAGVGSGARTIGVLAVDGNGARVAYRKMWLGSAESGCFAPGTAPAVLDIDGWRIGLAVCRDTGIPEHAAATAALGIDVYAAGVLETAEDAHVPDERARRIAAAHGVWVAIASFAGSTGEGYDHAAGGSGIWSPDGSVVDRVGSEIGAMARATLPG